MPSDLTIFAAKYLVFIDGLLAVLLLLFLFSRRPRADLIRWIVAAVIILVLSLVFAKIGGSVYSDPRPFTQDHVRPLIAHAPDNGFPSDHALLAAAIVALVAIAAPFWSLPFVVLGVLVDWARVGAGIHHVADVIGSSVMVAIATLIALLLAPLIVRWLEPYLPNALRGSPASAPPG